MTMTKEPPAQSPVVSADERNRGTARVVPSKSGGFAVEIHGGYRPIEVVGHFDSEAEAQAHADTINGGPVVD
jgi:hypothetical protein